MQLGQEEILGEIDQQEIAFRWMRNEVQFMREDECQCVAWEGPYHTADVLHGVAAEVDLNLKILVAMRRGFCLALGLAADVKIRPLTALLHAVGGDAIDGIHRVLLVCVSYCRSSYD